MERRAFLGRVTGLVGGACGLVGCADLDGGGRSDGVETRDLPDRPEQLTPETVTEYVADYEEVRAHNRHAESGAAEVNVRAVATFDHTDGGDHYATGQHTATVSRRDGSGERFVDEFDSDPTPYLIAPARTVRMDVRRRRIDDESRGRPDESVTTPPLGVRICNVTDDPRELAVTVVRREATSGEGNDLATGSDGNDEGFVIETSVAVDPESALELRGITDVRGSYRVTASMAENGVTSEGRIEVGLPSADRGPNVDVAVDDDGISTHHLPTFEPV